MFEIDSIEIANFGVYGMENCWLHGLQLDYVSMMDHFREV